MNLQLFTYALEVQKTGSITHAASNLFMSQPSLSKAIKDLESSLGFVIFMRSSKGVVPTEKGSEFLIYARKIVTQIQKMEIALQAKDTSNQLFSLAIPRVSYIAEAAVKYISSFDSQRNMEIDLLETSSLQVIEEVAYGHFVLGVIQCLAADEDSFVKSMAEKDLQYENIWKSGLVALMSEKHPLSAKKNLTPEDFKPYIEIAFGDEKAPNMANTIQHEEAKKVWVYDRATQLDLLRANPNAYMWVAPMPQAILQGNHLVQRKCPGGGMFSDLLISRSGYRFSKLDRAFIDTLYLQKNKVAYEN